jgi:hypothetical protein
MNPFIVIDQLGIIKRSGALRNPNDIARQPLGPGETIVPNVSGRPGHDRYTNGKVEPHIVLKTLSERKAELLATLAQRRWEVETGGVLFGVIRLETDDRSKLLITQAAARAKRDSTYSVRWKVGPGEWLPLDATTLIAAETTVFEHVQACFAREAELCVAIENANGSNLTNLEASVRTFWP